VHFDSDAEGIADIPRVRDLPNDGFDIRVEAAIDACGDLR